MTKQNGIFYLFRYTWLFLVLFIVVYHIKDNGKALYEVFLNTEFSMLCLGLLMELLRRGTAGIRWVLLAKVICGREIELVKLARCFFVTNIYSYLPGGIWHHMTRSTWLKKYGVTYTNSFKVSIFDQGIMFISGIILLDIAFIFSSDEIFLILFFQIVLILTILFFVRQIFLNASHLKSFYSVCLLGLFASLLAWLFGAAAFYFYYRSLVQVISVSNLSVLFETYMAGWLSGIVSIWAPQGIGVREGVFIYGLREIMAEQTAIVISILSRSTIFLADLALFSFYWVRGR